MCPKECPMESMGECIIALAVEDYYNPVVKMLMGGGSLADVIESYYNAYKGE